MASKAVCRPWFTGKVGNTMCACPGLHRKADWFTHALVYTGRQTTLYMPWFIQEGKLLYTFPGLHRKANRFTHALAYTGRQTALCLPWFAQGGKLVYTDFIHMKANWFMCM